jgi:hypothetical protein
MDEDVARLLLKHDDRTQWEHPAAFDHKRATAKFSTLAQELERRIGRPIVIETGTSIQDASFHSQIQLDGGWLRFSNFGEMIALTPDNEVPADVVGMVKALASEHGYVFVPTAALERPYPATVDGASSITTWWIRFFDWL